MRASLLAIALALSLLGLGALTAEAVEPPNHVELHTIATGPAVESPPKAERLKDACGVAVGASGRVYVSNYYDHAVYLLTLNETAHTYQFTARVDIPEVPGPPPGGKPVDGPCDLAVDTVGNLYVNNWHRDVVRLTPTSPGSTTFEPGVVIDSNHPTGVTVDPVTNHVFIDDRTPEEGSSVAEYEAAPGAGALPLRRIGLDSIGNGYGVAVSQFAGSPGFPSTAGWVYVADAADGTVKAFNPAESLTEPKQTIDGAGTPEAGFNSLVDTDIAVDSRDGHIYVVDNLQPGFESPEAVVDEFSSLGHYRGPVPPRVASGHPSEIVDAEPSAIAISGLGEVFLSSGNYFNDGTLLPDNTPRQDSQVKVFGPAASVETRIVTTSKSGAGSGTIFSSDPSGLRCGTACEGEFPLGRGVVLVAQPAPHSRFAGWTGCPNVLADGRCSLTLNADIAIAAEFEPIPQQTLSVTVGGQGSVASAPAGIVCSVSCSASFDEGSPVILTATAFAGSVFAGWSGCDAEPEPGACTVTMSSARAVAATFAPILVPPPPPLPPPPPRTLSVIAGGTDGATGSVTSSPGGIDCGTTCTRLYADGTAVTLEAHPAAGSSFLGWGGCDSSDGLRCTVALGSDKTVAAAFGPGSPGPLRIRGVAVHGEAATLRVAVPTAGELTASSPRLQPASALPIQAGVVALRLHLNAAGARALASAGRNRLSVPVTLAFAPFDGGTAVTARKPVTFGVAPSPARGSR